MFAQREDGEETSTPEASGTDVPSRLLSSEQINRRRDTGGLAGQFLEL